MKFLRILSVSAVLLACKGDEACILYPCPVPVAAIVTVAAANAAGPVPGAQLIVNGTQQGGGCSAAQVTTCEVFGGTGRYDIEASAPGYASARTTVTVTGTDAGCNSCGEIDRQFVTVTLQPLPQAARQ
ncbi:MAG TPA: hypothetical protein VGD77_05035 [Gemmatimonadaceae bacterium]